VAAIAWLDLVVALRCSHLPVSCNFITLEKEIMPDCQTSLCSFRFLASLSCMQQSLRFSACTLSSLLGHIQHLACFFGYPVVHHKNQHHLASSSAMGKSRSTTCIIAYLMHRDDNLTPSEALSRLRGPPTVRTQRWLPATIRTLPPDEMSRTWISSPPISDGSTSESR
jgi:hypothetical protein